MSFERGYTSSHARFSPIVDFERERPPTCVGRRSPFDLLENLQNVQRANAQAAAPTSNRSDLLGDGADLWCPVRQLHADGMVAELQVLSPVEAASLAQHHEDRARRTVR